MMRKRPLLATLVAATAVFVTATGPALAQGPDRVPRVMALWDFGESTPLTWDTVVAEGSVAIVVTGKNGDGGGSKDTALLYPDVIKDTIKHNLPGLTDEEVAVLSLPLEIALDHGYVAARDQRVTFVKNGGVEHPYVYFDSPEPPPGATAQAGPDGDITVLGRFYFRAKTSADENYPWYLTDVDDGVMLVIPPSHVASSDFKMLLAIGWFTK